jgi:hypothetical protein
MDPYLERHWRDIHHNFITFAQGQLNEVLPGDLMARVEERVVVEAPDAGPRTVYPDVRVIEHGWGKDGAPAVAGGVAVTEPLLIDLLEESATEGFIEIIDLSTGARLTTVIEVLSPTNKQKGLPQDQYRQKREDMKAGRVNFVEIDLLRSGVRISMVAPERLPARFQTPYLVCTWRSRRLARCEVYPISLREPLPTIAIPLRASDPDVPLNLQTILEQCYHNGRYDRIDYRLDPDPPLDPADAAWADALLRSKGKR